MRIGCGDSEHLGLSASSRARGCQLLLSACSRLVVVADVLLLRPQDVEADSCGAAAPVPSRDKLLALRCRTLELFDQGCSTLHLHRITFLFRSSLGIPYFALHFRSASFIHSLFRSFLSPQGSTALTYFAIILTLLVCLDIDKFGTAYSLLYVGLQLLCV